MVVKQGLAAGHADALDRALGVHAQAPLCYPCPKCPTDLIVPARGNDCACSQVELVAHVWRNCTNDLARRARNGQTRRRKADGGKNVIAPRLGTNVKQHGPPGAWVADCRFHSQMVHEQVFEAKELVCIFPYIGSIIPKPEQLEEGKQRMRRVTGDLVKPLQPE